MNTEKTTATTTTKYVIMLVVLHREKIHGNIKVYFFLQKYKTITTHTHKAHPLCNIEYC